jgi:putative FmdB family regulatory protein
MPIYEYQCAACGHQLEAMQKMSEEPLKDCPECHKPALSKLVSAAGFQLKGTGWYVTDYSAKGKAKSASEAGNKEQTATGTDSKPSETKTSASTTTTDTKTSSTDSGAKSS